MNILSKQNFLKLSVAILLLTNTGLYAQPSCCCSCTNNAQEKQVQVAQDNITVEVNIGEMIDKITILEIKNEKINDPAKLKNIRTELQSLTHTRDKKIIRHLDKETQKKFNDLCTQLREINTKLWELEDATRCKEGQKCFDNEFIALARTIYTTNDQRFKTKREINELLGSNIIEEKSYEHCNFTKKSKTKQPNNIKDTIMVEVSIGEMIDKITILEIKNEKINDPAKLVNITKELETLTETREEKIFKYIDETTRNILDNLTAQLLEINTRFWDIQVACREKEKAQCFDQEFIEVVRSVYYTNDERGKVKRKINDLLGSKLVEEKAYTAY